LESAAAAAVGLLAAREGGGSAAGVRILETGIRGRGRPLPALDLAKLFDEKVPHLSLLETTDPVFFTTRQGRPSHGFGVVALGLGAALDLLELFDKQLPHRSSSSSKVSDQPEPPKATVNPRAGQDLETSIWAATREA
jgi:hypothetical protein